MSSTSPNMGLTIPDINDEVTDFVTDLAANFTFLDAIYPVGSIYLSTASTNPGTFLGGTWAAIQGVSSSVSPPATLQVPRAAQRPTTTGKARPTTSRRLRALPVPTS